MNNNFYTAPLSPEAQRRLAMQQQNGHGHNHPHPHPHQHPHPQHPSHSVGMVDAGNVAGLGQTGPISPVEGMQMAAGDSLDDIVNQNNREFQRRRSVGQLFTTPLSPQDVDQRMTMMDYDNPADAMQGFSFGFTGGSTLPSNSEAYSQDLMGMPAGQPNFETLSPTSLGMNAFSNLDMGSMTTDPSSMNLFNAPNLNNQYSSTNLDTVRPDFTMDMGVENTPVDASGVSSLAGFAVGPSSGMIGGPAGFDTSSVSQGGSNMMPAQFRTAMSPTEPRESPTSATFRSPASPTSRTVSMSSGGRSGAHGAATPASTAPTALSGPLLPPGISSRNPKRDVYSKSGFDMLRALFYVATRKNPTVEIGAVDLSCAFVVTDVTLNDCPIIYVSDNFQNLTGYNRHEIVGNNCRFLQSPDGKVEAGSRREFVANDAVFKLKNAVAEGKEIQQSLINYRKGGKPFLNLLTMIPIPWDSDEIKYCIGFQIDLVECPEAISGQVSGNMQVNYRHSDIGQYFWALPSTAQWEPESGQTLSVDDVSSLIQQHNPKAPPSEWHKQSWDKMLLENADDVVHVLSLKGLFLYLSPACKKTLEYDASDLVGTSLSSICHPSDIVPVTRELKDAQQNQSVNIAFRIRRKHSGYTWFESHGTLFHEQQAKGRKYIILVGRKRPVFSLRRRDVLLHAASVNGTPGVHAGIGGESEIWSKVSTSGMFLYVSSSAKPLLDLSPRDLEGTSMQDLMRKESRAEFGRVIEKARKGSITGLRHEVLHKRGQLVQALTTFFPGDGTEVGMGSPGPSFLIAQTKLIKGGRVIAAGKSGATTSGNFTAASAAGPSSDDTTAGSLMKHPSLAQIPATVQASLTVTYPDLSMDSDSSDEGGDIFAELKTTRCTSWQYELRQMEKVNRLLAEELTQLMANKKKRKRRKGGGAGFGGNGSGSPVVRDCANCHKRDTPEWRRGPSGNRDLCNSCGLRWAKQTGKVSPRNTSRASSDASAASKRPSLSRTSTNSPASASPLRREVSTDSAESAGERSTSTSSGREMRAVREE
ncbi:PAS domain-containing protein [Chaetomium sp. MPI-SDFR-AT-0129]|nr:PAS domain-containing protein [Chaetomium sp. MPI-SDFR-AT-0129]